MKTDSSKSQLDRREFLKRTVLGAAGLGLAGSFSACTTAQVKGADETVNLAVVGLRGKGRSHINNFRELPGVRIVAICDADTEMIDREKARFAEWGQPVRTYQDVRLLLEDKDVDAVVLATPNHWHTLMTIWALDAGKHVYVEKPLSYDVWEGRQLAIAAAQSPLVVQHGCQKRSEQALIDAVEYIRSGTLGPIKVARGFCYKRRKSIGLVDGPQPIPETVDYNLWTGPAALVPLTRKHLHYDWHWVWNTGNGDLGNQGIHEVDLARWFLGDPGLPKRVLSVGGRFGYVDNGESANTQAIWFDYDEAPLLFEVRGLPVSPEIDAMDNYKGIRIGIVIECEEGYFAGGGGGGWAYSNDGERLQAFKGTGGSGHAQNFIDAVRANDPRMAAGQPESGHISSALCHLGNISHRVGWEKPPVEIAESIQGNSEMTDAFERMLEHTARNQVDFSITPSVLGAGLACNPATERFAGDFSEDANALLRREPREGFVVPDLG